MIRKTGEFHHHTSAEVRAYLAGAAEIVDDLELREDLREVAFGKAIELLATKQIAAEQSAVSGGLLAVPKHG